jgi:sulfite exporter TauE/SafE
VPLSEDEQRILSEIEQHLYASDPQLVREVSSTTIYRHAGRNLKWAAVGFIAGLVVMLATFTTSLVLAFAGVLGMLASAIFFERNLRKMGRAGWRQWTESMRANGVRDRIGSAGDNLRDRFKRER